MRFQSQCFQLKMVLQFFEKGFRFPENLSQSLSIEISTDFPIKTCRSRTRRAISKISNTAF